MGAAIREATRADVAWVVGAVTRLASNGTAADARFRLAPGAADRLREHFAHAWFGRFVPFPAAWIAEHDGAPVGVVTGEVVEAGLLARPPTARIDNLWVEPDHRRQGVARDLVVAFRDRAARAGFATLQVSTLARDARAVAFWHAMGLTELHVILVSDPPEAPAEGSP